MKSIRSVVMFIGVGMSLAFSILVYAHTTFATKYNIDLIEQQHDKIDDTIIRRLDRIDKKLDRILFKGE